MDDFVQQQKRKRLPLILCTRYENPLIRNKKLGTKTMAKWAMPNWESRQPKPPPDALNMEPPRRLFNPNMSGMLYERAQANDLG